MNRSSVFLVLMWFSNWLVTSSAIPLDMEAAITLNIHTDDLELSKCNNSIWLRMRLQLSSWDLKTRDTAAITATADTTSAPAVLPTQVPVTIPTTTTVAQAATTTTSLPTPKTSTACKPGFTQLGNHCYFFSYTTATFSDASIECHRLGAELAHPKNSQENSQIANYLRKYISGAILHRWIGATDRDNESQWVWAHDNTPVSYSDWADGEPNDEFENEDCTYFSSYNNYQWNDAPCYNKFPYICQQGNSDDDSQVQPRAPLKAESTTTTAASLTVSQSDIVQLGERSYYFSTTTASFEDASKACQSIGTALAHPQNTKDNSLIKEYIRNHKGTAKSWWIGATDRENEGQWVWAHDKSKLGYSDWSNGEPTDSYENEDCAQFRSAVNYEWNATPCESKYNYICQYGNRDDDSPGIASGTFAIPTATTTIVTTFATTTTSLPTTETTAACTDDFSRVGGHCYYFSTTKATFNDASIACYSLGAGLAHPKNSEENSKLIQYMRENSSAIQLWIGATDRDNEGQWVWAHDNNPVGYSDWDNGEPNDEFENEDCTYLSSYLSNTYKWNDAPCNHKLPYICQQGNADNDSQGQLRAPLKSEGVTATAAPLNVSTSDIVQLGDHHYYFSTTTATFDDASEACQSIGTALAHPQNANDNSLINEYIRNHKETAKSWWMGATDRDKEGQWVWAHDNSPVSFTDWSNGEPTDSYENEDCAQFRSAVNFKWNDTPCESKYSYICQF